MGIRIRNPQFVSTDEPHALLRMLQLSAVFMLLTLVVFAAHGVPKLALTEK